MNTEKVYGLDPSFTGFGISDGTRHECYHTDPVRANDATDEESHLFRVNALLMNISAFVGFPHEDERVILWTEAPQMRVPAHGGSHLYQLGWLMHALYVMAAQRSLNGALTQIRLVTRGTYLKTLFGKGVVADTELGKIAYRKYGIDIFDDRGLDKLDAWCLYRFGCGVRDGEWEFSPNKRALKVRATAK